MLLIIHIYKGWLYVIVSSIILYLLINTLLRKVDLTEKKLNESYKELSLVNEELEAHVQQLTAFQEELTIQYDQIIESEKKLSKSEEKNRAIVKAMPDLLFIVNNDGYFIDCIASDESFLLMPKEDFIGKAIWEVIPDEISEIAYEKMQSVIKYGILEKFEYKLKISDKDQCFELRMVKNNEKEILAISRNVTVERQNELELRISEEKYKALVNEMQQGLAIYEGHFEEEEVGNYRFVDSNKSHEKITGLKSKDILGKTIYEIFPNIKKSVIEKYRHVMKTGEPICYESYLQDMDRHYELKVYTTKKLQLAVIVTDITKRKKAEESVKSSECTFRNLFENSSDAILIISDDKIVDCNLAMIKTLGYDSKSSIVGKCPFEFYPEKQPDGESSKEKVFKMRKNTIENGKCKFEWWHKRVDGSLLPVEVMLTTIFLNGKKVFHSLWRDINDRKQMELKLEYLSYHDQLTGLYNRRFFEQELRRLDKEENLPLTIIMADVNGLKLVNDSLGHAIGDELLKKVAKAIMKGCRATDIIARLGGDEFVILLPNTGTYETEQILKRIKSIALKEMVGAVEISISFGYETKKNVNVKIAEVLKKSEDFMYKKKLFDSPSMRGKTISAIISTLHEKNKREEQHSHRVSALCQNMGKVLGLHEDEIKELETVGLLHDIGKIAIEENILNKPGKLTDEEWEQIKRHPEIGYRILSTVNDMSEMAEYVLAHHERWDGMGYPKGLTEEEIPLQSRIIAIADSYDAMISERSYRNALPEEVAIKELKLNAGIQFDPELIKIFIEKVLDKPCG
jgi:diguanylate cyclase (GGDEF)-like protein/PAS domain S-box-containing protein